MPGRAREDEERGQGVPLTDEERQWRHYAEHGCFLMPNELPPRGSGLAGVGNGIIPEEGGCNWWWLLLIAALLLMGKKEKKAPRRLR